MEMYPQCIPRNSSSLVGLCSVFRRCAAGRVYAEHVEISTKSSNSKGPGSCLPGPILGADGQNRSFVTQSLQASADVASHMFEIPHKFLQSLYIIRKKHQSSRKPAVFQRESKISFVLSQPSVSPALLLLFPKSPSRLFPVFLQLGACFGKNSGSFPPK